VGTKRAAAILALRQRLGRFRRTSDLLRVKGIGPRTLQRMLPHLVLD
jgi:competence protein ComEA